ncbi:NAD(P)H-quinone oxidoreductase [Mucilaginibacter lutimaris]|uniref:NAD(P)H-quinone oxidoreductase n=1 Tax=Mucilaginibacter lutimaris TaxID=931629 RepID=A0ABW2ZBQ8_9SPHI
MMKAIVITQPGGPEVLKIEERPIPAYAATDVLIKVMAAGINRPDVAQRKGNYPPPAGAPADVPGLEVAGIIAEVGADVARWRVGDKVCALVTGGGYAEYCPAPEGQCLPMPENFSFAEAASLPETFFTVWSNVFDRGRLQAGESLLVHGGSSGIGVAAIQMTTALGSKVYVTAGSDEKCRFCEELGAERAINYNNQDFGEEIAKLTDGKGVDVILDMIGGSYTGPNIKSLANDGRLVFINIMKGKSAEIDIAEVMRKRIYITGSMLRPRDVAFKSAIAQNLQTHIWPLLASGKITPVVYRIYPVAEASKAHQLMETSRHMGKIVLEF